MGTFAAFVVTAGSFALGGSSSAQVEPGDGFFNSAEGRIAEPAVQREANPAIAGGQNANKALSKKITKRFTNVNLSEVLAWLSLQDLSFVADMGAFPDKKVTFNFVNQPMSEIMAVIAETFGGTWQRKGDIYTLTPRASLTRPVFGEFYNPRNIKADAGKAEKTFTFAETPLVKLPSFNVKTLAEPAREFKWDGQALLQLEKKKELTSEQRKDVEKAVAQAKEAIKKAIEELKSHKGEIQGLDDKQLSELIKQLNEIIGKTLPNMFESQPFKGGDSKTFFFEGPKGEFKFGDPKSEAQMKELMGKMKVLEGKDLEKMADLKGLQAKELGERMKVLERMDLDKVIEKQMKEGMDLQKMKVDQLSELRGLEGLKGLQSKALEERMKALEKMDLEKDLKFKGLGKENMALDKALQERMKAFDKMDLGKMEGLQMFKAQSFGDLLKSLTPEQKAMAKKKGSLNFSDLSERQRGMLGGMGAGKWEITISQNGEKITIKNGS